MVTRRERVLLELEDNFTRQMVQAAGATQLLKRELNSLSGTSVNTSRDSDRVSKSLASVGTSAAQTSKQLRDGQRDLDRYSGRLGIFLKLGAALGPAIVPVGAAAIPVMAGLTAGIGAAAAAVGVAVIAFNGMGDALKAIDAARIEPTTANLEKMRAELDRLGPAGADFAHYLSDLGPTLRDLQNLARAGLLPGVEEGIDGLLKRLPELRRFLFDVSTEMGNLTADMGGALGGEKFDAFFNFLETDGVRTLHDFAAATGNVAEGLANMVAAFAPVSRDFNTGMVEMTQSFADWSAGLSASDGFKSFMDYLQQAGPQVVDLIGQLALSLAAVAEAAAPVGAVLVPALTQVAKLIETIAQSDLGTPLFAGLAAMSALRLATQAWANVSTKSIGTFVAGQGRAAASIMQVTTAQERATMSATQLASVQQQRTRTTMAAMGRMAAVAAGLAVATTGAADGLGLSNTAMLGLMGTMAGPWGTAAGTAVGLTMDVAAANNGLEESVRRVQSAMDNGASIHELSTELLALDAQIKSTAETFDNFHPFSVDLSNPIKSATDNVKGWVAGLNELVTGSEKAAVAQRDEGQAALEAQAAHERYAGAVGMSARVARQTRTEINGLVTAMEEQTNAALGAFDAVTQYGNALNAAREAAKKGKRGIDENTEAGRENRDALSQLAGAWNNQSDAVRNNVGKWRQARDEFVKNAVQMGVNADKAKALADRLMEIPRSVVIKMEAKSDPALQAIARIKRELASVPRSLTTTYYVNQINRVNKGPVTGPGSDADGGTIPGQRYPYGDKMLYMLAPGEEVISNRRGQADRFRPLLKAINNAADGATVGVGTFGGNDGTARSVRSLNAALDKLTKSLEKETRVRDDLRQQMQEVRSSVTDGLRSDIFGTGSVWGAGMDPVGSLRGDIRQGKHFIDLVKELARKGVDGAALQEIIASGDVQRAEFMAQMTRGSLRTYERLYDQREHVLSLAGGAATQALGLPSHIDRVTDEIRELRGDVKQLQHAIKVKQAHDHKSRQEAADRTGDRVNGAAKNGHRRGHSNG